MLIIGNEGVRLISRKRARKLRKQYIFVAWSPTLNSHYWYWADLILRKPLNYIQPEHKDETQ